jgi:hypothetical protein
MAGCFTSPDTTQRFVSGTAIDARSAGMGKPTPSVEKIQRSTRGSRRSAPALAPPDGSSTWGVTTPR